MRLDALILERQRDLWNEAQVVLFKFAQKAAIELKRDLGKLGNAKGQVAQLVQSMDVISKDEKHQNASGFTKRTPMDELLGIYYSGTEHLAVKQRCRAQQHADAPRAELRRLLGRQRERLLAKRDVHRIIPGRDEANDANVVDLAERIKIFLVCRANEVVQGGGTQAAERREHARQHAARRGQA